MIHTSNDLIDKFIYNTSNYDDENTYQLFDNNFNLIDNGYEFGLQLKDPIDMAIDINISISDLTNRNLW